MKQKSLILMISVALIVMMAVSVVSAGWFTGKATDSNTIYTIYHRQSKNVKAGENTYKIGVKTVVGISRALLDIDGTSHEVKLGVNQIGNLQIDVKLISPKKFMGKAFVKFSVAEITTKSKCSGTLCTLYDGETLSYGEDTFKLQFISQNSIKIERNSEELARKMGVESGYQTYHFIDVALKVIVKEISVQDYVGGEKYVTFHIVNIHEYLLKEEGGSIKINGMNVTLIDLRHETMRFSLNPLFYEYRSGSNSIGEKYSPIEITPKEIFLQEYVGGDRYAIVEIRDSFAGNHGNYTIN